MRQSHIFDPRHIAALESEDRRVWQDPDRILNAVELKPQFVVADVGCGSGYFTVQLSKRVKKVYGIDVQEEMLSFLEDKVKRLRIANIKLLLSKPDEIPLKRGAVDLLMSVNTLHEFANKEKMIEEMRRVVKKGGKLLIVDFKKEETGFGPPVRIRMRQDEAIRLFERNGLTLSKARELPYHYLLVFAKD
jgi:ubiquinone/menaquinone biosynthesis C-methylase UbiE